MHRHRTVEVSVPATSANLGPGFDSLGVALSLRDRVRVTVVDTPGVEVRVTGTNPADVPTDERNLVARIVLEQLARYGQRPTGLCIESELNIPHARGLGSSAAAAVSAIAAANELLDRPMSPAQVFAAACEEEGHPDNVAPAVYGGLTVAWAECRADGEPAFGAQRFEPVGVVRPVVFVPDYEVSTRAARSLQPPQVPLGDAVFNLSRAALLVANLTVTPGNLMRATEDRLHQPYRAAAMTPSVELMSSLREEDIPAVISGAGPTVLALTRGEQERMRARRVVDAQHGVEWLMHELAFSTRGVESRVVSEDRAQSPC